MAFFAKVRSRGTFADKIKDCAACNFYQAVQNEEGSLLTSSYAILEKVQR